MGTCIDYGGSCMHLYQQKQTVELHRVGYCKQDTRVTLQNPHAEVRHFKNSTDKGEISQFGWGVFQKDNTQITRGDLNNCPRRDLKTRDSFSNNPN